MTRLDLETMRRVSEVLRDAGYASASDYVHTWASMPQAMREDVRAGQEPFTHFAPERNQPAIAELAERLTKVEDRQDEFEQRTVKALSHQDERFNAQNAGRHQLEAALNARIDKVAEIIGERISGLIDRLDKLEKPWAYPPTEAIDAAFAALPPDAHGTIAPGEMERVLQAAARAAFPTGGATTAEAAADAVLPVPQRGDRVRLEGAKTLAFYSVPDGWYDVAGQNGDAFQIRVPQFGGDWLPYIPNANEGLKEVRHAENT